LAGDFEQPRELRGGAASGLSESVH